MRLIPTLLLLTTTAFARLGDTREQAEARYGLPKKEKPPVGAQPLIDGARELTFEYEGWRIRCALLLAKDGQEYIVREEYTKIWNSQVMKAGGSPQIRDFELKAVLSGESNGSQWSDVSTGDFIGKTIGSIVGKGPNPVLGKVFRRSDGAQAVVLLGNASVRFDLPQATKYEAELKAIKDQQARQKVPKF